jgi:hypothetical protein
VWRGLDFSDSFYWDDPHPSCATREDGTKQITPPKLVQGKGPDGGAFATRSLPSLMHLHFRIFDDAVRQLRSEKRAELGRAAACRLCGKFREIFARAATEADAEVSIILGRRGPTQTRELGK